MELICDCGKHISKIEKRKENSIAICDNCPLSYTIIKNEPSKWIIYANRMRKIWKILS